MYSLEMLCSVKEQVCLTLSRCRQRSLTRRYCKAYDFNTAACCTMVCWCQDTQASIKVVACTAQRSFAESRIKCAWLSLGVEGVVVSGNTAGHRLSSLQHAVQV